MATQDSLTAKVRKYLGDLPEPVRTSIRGNGEQTDFELTGRNLLPSSMEVFRVEDNGDFTDLVLDTDYTLDTDNGIIYFTDAPAADVLIIVEGSAFSIFSDLEISEFVTPALQQHTSGRTTVRRFKDSYGFIKYDRVPMDIDSLPDAEEPLVALLASLQAVWAMVTDAATDIDVSTSEGTNIPRSQRFRQLMELANFLEDQYERVSMAMGVGLYAPEVFTVRRKSRQNGRLVPIFQEQEYDEYGPPTRIVVPVQQRDADPDGPPSPFFAGGFGY